MPLSLCLYLFSFQETTEMTIIITGRENVRLHYIAIQML